MANQEAMMSRNRIIGIALRDARNRASKSKKECAEALGVSTATITSYEEGRKQISLPELEVLAYLFDVPANVFWDEEAQLAAEERVIPLDQVMQLRQRIVGALLRQARIREGKTQQDLAELLGCSSRKVSSYEYGEKGIPLVELEVLASALDQPLSYFVGDWADSGEQKLESYQVFQQLPKDIREFVSLPINRSYLELAMRLATMPAGALRQIAEGLLEITY
jgi:transcriptional regulator with XRE-family HTH domain